MFSILSYTLYTTLHIQFVNNLFTILWSLFTTWCLWLYSHETSATQIECHILWTTLERFCLLKNMFYCYLSHFVLKIKTSRKVNLIFKLQWLQSGIWINWRIPHSVFHTELWEKISHPSFTLWRIICSPTAQLNNTRLKLKLLTKSR